MPFLEMTVTRYWTCIYDYATWLEREPGLACWADKRQKLLSDLGPGDVIAPYIPRVGWVGLWTMTSPAERDPHRSPWNEDFPIVAAYEVELELEPTQALRTADIPSPDVNLRTEDGVGLPYPFMFQASGVELPDNVGSALASLLRAWVASPTTRELSSRQTDYSSRPERATTDLGTVSIPPGSDDSDELLLDDDGSGAVRVTEHTRVQRQLLELGRDLGFAPWVTPDDRSKQLDAATKLSDLPEVTSQLPSQFNEATNKTIRHIDVMWLNGSRIEAAFEVENSTSIYSGILRMADLLALQPNVDIPLYLVVPEGRQDKARYELTRPVFQAMQRPLSQRCRILTYDSLDALVELARQARGALKVDVIKSFAFRAEDGA